jgi:hypothetical protein
VLDVYRDGRLPPPVASDGVRTVAKTHRERPSLGSLCTLGAGLQLVDCDDSASGRCYADSFVREGPAPDDTEAMSELDSTLKDLRRLIFELMNLDLPIQPYYADPHRLAFDLLSSKTLGRPVTIGHANGVITIDPAESLELYRERLRIKMHEPYRTMLGHFRHEVGHYYEMLLVQDTPLIDDARAMLGDDRQDYRAALQRHYQGQAPADWHEDYISEYATAHPWEDFAETWAHYLHITGTLATIADSGLVVEADRVKVGSARQCQRSGVIRLRHYRGHHG